MDWENGGKVTEWTELDWPAKIICTNCGTAEVVVSIGVTRGFDPSEYYNLHCGHREM